MVQKEQKTALLLLGHGSKVREANQVLYEIVAGVKRSLDHPIIEVAFLQLAEPLLEEGIERCVAQGADRIVLIPYFLYLGAHVGSDIPLMLAEARERYPGMEILQGNHLGVHPKLVEVVLDRIAETENREDRRIEASRGREIEEQSYEIIHSGVNSHARSPEELAVVKRTIHATADFSWERELLFHPEAVGRGMEALKRGASLVTDVNMVRVGIRESLLQPFGGRAYCHIADSGLIGTARSGEEATRAALGIRKARVVLKGGVVVIGNAPTALEEVLRLALEEGVTPSLVVGVPVGLVGAAESKEALLQSGIPYITNQGRKGGSPLAVSITNALLKLASEV